MKKYDVSIHFSIKNQSIELITKKFNDWCDESNSLPFDFSERSYEISNFQMRHTEPRSVLHHCFLPKRVVLEKGLPEDILDFLDMISENIICWQGTSMDGDSLCWDRRLMLENLKKVNGIAIFIGEITGGVNDEFEIVKELGIDHVIIN